MKSISLTLFCLLVAWPFVLWSQSKIEIKEFSGEVIRIQPWWNFRLDRLLIKSGDEELQFSFNPELARKMLDTVRPGDEVIVRAEADPLRLEGARKWNIKVREGKERRGWIMDTGRLVAIQKGGSWISLPFPSQDSSWWKNKYTPPSRLFLDRRVIGEYTIGGKRYALIFQDSIVGTGFPVMMGLPGVAQIQTGDTISFGGYILNENPSIPNSVYPISGVKQVCFFNRLMKLQGKIKSFLYKQNHVCIGLVIKGDFGEKRLSFPGPYAERLQSKTAAEEEVTVYCSAFGPFDTSLNPPELHAIRFRNELFEIPEFGFYGGADVKHEHKPAEITGKVTAIVHSDKGKILNIIVGRDCYVELDEPVIQQLGNKLTKGKLLTVNGVERIPAQGEVYDEHYRIILPTSITLDGISYLLNQIRD